VPWSPRRPIKQRIVSLRERGVSAVSVNSWLTGINAFLRWRGDDFKIPKLQTEKKILRTFTPEDVQRLLTHKIKSKSQSRIQSLAALLLDTGLRIAEALQLCTTDIDLDNHLIRVQGKGRKERLVPFSMGGRKVLYKLCRNGVIYSQPHRGLCPSVMRRGTSPNYVFARESRGSVAAHIPFDISFAVHYLRSGGNLEYLRRILGHSSILVTQRYLQSIQPTDLRKIHNDLSPLGRSL
jgi:integrase/recombinase XerD